MNKWLDLIRKSAGAAVLIGLGNFALLKLGNPLGPIIFAFGLLGVCYLGQNLFTGKCGFLFQDKIPVLDLLVILVVNLIAGYLVGMLFAAADPSIVSAASDKVASWDFSMAYFIKSVLCGVVMYLAVAIYKKGSPLGIIFGIPLFIFCGFQHCIANVITMGVASGFSWSLVLAVVGNFVGSLLIWCLAGELAPAKSKKTSKIKS
ncbi:formate/nitrite transporter family protein [Candidatus Saccharibacteria bacterium]|nr:formate/nitrite transporter family protein [Candidatus Saccharibacteria bacterium]